MQRAQCVRFAGELRVPWASAFYLFCGRCFGISNMAHQINEEIRDREVRVIAGQGEQRGIKSGAEAEKISEVRGFYRV